MKALFISYNQAYSDEVLDILEKNGQRGFTRWTSVQGRGSCDGIPHLGNHAWPEQNHAVFCFVEDGLAGRIKEELQAKDAASPELGLRVFSWTVD